MTVRFLTGTRFSVGIGESSYPNLLREARRPPARLYGVGCPDALEPGLAVIGARKATPYGRSCAERFARIAARKGIVVISGGARGCDAAAHRGALREGGRTVAVLGGGCNCLYPAEHKDLFQQIADGAGAVVSEHPDCVPPKPYAFRERNRIIAGLARAVLIVEAGLPSGTFSTADEALEAGRPVLVVPGAITSRSSKGSNRLLFDGAMPVVDDDTFESQLFDVFGALASSPVSQGPSFEENDEIIEAIRAEPLSLEDILGRFASSVSSDTSQAREAVMERIVVAEAEGLVARQSDGRWTARLPD